MVFHLVIDAEGKTVYNNANTKSENETALFAAIDNSIASELNSALLAKAE